MGGLVSGSNKLKANSKSATMNAGDVMTLFTTTMFISIEMRSMGYESGAYVLNTNPDNCCAVTLKECSYITFVKSATSGFLISRVDAWSPITIKNLYSDTKYINVSFV